MVQHKLQRHSEFTRRAVFVSAFVCVLAIELPVHSFITFTLDSNTYLPLISNGETEREVQVDLFSEVSGDLGFYSILCFESIYMSVYQYPSSSNSK